MAADKIIVIALTVIHAVITIFFLDDELKLPVLSVIGCLACFRIRLYIIKNNLTYKSFISKHPIVSSMQFVSMVILFSLVTIKSDILVAFFALLYMLPALLGQFAICLWFSVMFNKVVSANET